MADLELSSILNLISTGAVICALIFTALQVRAANYSRRDQAAITLIQTTQDASWTEALNLLLVLPENATIEQIREQGASMERALFELSIRLEPIGYMVFCDIVSLRTVDDLCGGIVTAIWSRSRAWTEEYRRSTNNERFNEWVEWLADRTAERRTRSASQPAHRKYFDWRER